VLLGSAGFDPESVAGMTEVQILSYIEQLKPKSTGGVHKAFVNEARLRRKEQKK
jgi:hypothetical protein